MQVSFVCDRSHLKLVRPLPFAGQNRCETPAKRPVIIDSRREVQIANHIAPASASYCSAEQSRRPIHDALRRATSDVTLLSARQLDVLQLLADGLDNKAIAQQLGVSEATTKQYVTAILLKLRLNSRLQAGLVGMLALRVEASSQTEVHNPRPQYESITTNV